MHKKIKFEFELYLDEITVLENILNKNIASYHQKIMKVMTGEDKVGTIEYYENLMDYDEKLKNKIFEGISEKIIQNREEQL